MSAIKQFLSGLACPLLTLAVMARFGSIWKLKRHLKARQRPNKILRFVYNHYFLQRGSFVGLDSDIPYDPCFPHGLQGIFISNGAKLGRDCVIFQQVTIGSNTLADSDRAGAPTLGDRVYIGAGAKVIGKITVGDNCRIGANAVVYKDMPAHSVAVQAPTRIIQKEHLDNRYITTLDHQAYYFEDGALHPMGSEQ